MQIQIKKTIKAGNSSAVVLPKSWLDQEVRVELIKKNPKTILREVLDIAEKYIPIKEIVGIYLTGSYARKEETKESDIDILIITADTDKEIIHEGIYNLLIISKRLLKQKLENDLFPVGPMIKEARPLLNSDYLKSIEIKITKKNIKWYIDTTEEKLNLLQKILQKTKKEVDNKIIYTLILRIRTLCIIRKLIKNKDYSKKDFTRLIKKISKGDSYEAYLNIKNESGRDIKVSLEEACRLKDYLEKELKEVKDLLKK